MLGYFSIWMRGIPVGMDRNILPLDTPLMYVQSCRAKRGAEKYSMSWAQAWALRAIFAWSVIIKLGFKFQSGYSGFTIFLRVGFRIQIWIQEKWQGFRIQIWSSRALFVTAGGTDARRLPCNTMHFWSKNCSTTHLFTFPGHFNSLNVSHDHSESREQNENPTEVW